MTTPRVGTHRGKGGGSNVAATPSAGQQTEVTEDQRSRVRVLVAANAQSPEDCLDLLDALDLLTADERERSGRVIP